MDICWNTGDVPALVPIIKKNVPKPSRRTERKVTYDDQPKTYTFAGPHSPLQDISNRSNLLPTTSSAASEVCQPSVSNSSDSNWGKTNQRTYRCFGHLWQFVSEKIVFFDLFFSFFFFFKIDAVKNVLISSKIVPNQRSYRSLTIDTVYEPDVVYYPTRRLSCDEPNGKAKYSSQASGQVQNALIQFFFPITSHRFSHSSPGIIFRHRSTLEDLSSRENMIQTSSLAASEACQTSVSNSSDSNSEKTNRRKYWCFRHLKQFESVNQCEPVWTYFSSICFFLSSFSFSI